MARNAQAARADQGQADAREPVAATRELTEAEKAAALDHLELRVAELASYVRAEAATTGADPKALAGVIADRLTDLL